MSAGPMSDAGVLMRSRPNHTASAVLMIRSAPGDIQTQPGATADRFLSPVPRERIGAKCPCEACKLPIRRFGCDAIGAGRQGGGKNTRQQLGRAARLTLTAVAEPECDSGNAAVRTRNENVPFGSA